MNAIIDQYLKLQQQIFDHCGYVEDWVKFPLCDRREYVWYLDGETPGSYLHYADTEEELQSESGEYYESRVLGNSFLPRSVFRGKELTLVLVDPESDSNRWLQICSNNKEKRITS